MNDAQSQARLAEALVGERWRALYLNSAEFHANIEVLARMLPIWIDAFATQAVGADKAMAAEISQMMFRPRPVGRPTRSAQP